MTKKLKIIKNKPKNLDKNITILATLDDDDLAIIKSIQKTINYQSKKLKLMIDGMNYKWLEIRNKYKIPIDLDIMFNEKSGTLYTKDNE